MHVISRKALVEFGQQHPDAAAPLDAWYRIVKAATFADVAAVKVQFGSASVLSCNRMVFNIGGNKYQLVVGFAYPTTATAVAEIAALMEQEPAPGTPAHDTPALDRLEVLTLLVGAYDDAHYPMGDASTPQDVVDVLLEQNGMTRAQLAPLLGGRSRVSDFFNGVRSLSMNQVQALRARFRVSADLLLRRRACRARFSLPTTPP